ncbi:MAG: hypothetical protein ACK42D_00200 [Candidatus Paceibacteria bacterium]
MYTKIILTILFLIIGYFAYLQYTNTPAPNTVTPEEVPSTPPQLSADGKSIIRDGSVILRITDDAIVSYFRDESTGLCDQSNISNTATREAFCNNLSVFETSTSFIKIIPSATGNKIGFVVATDELAPDTALGIFYPQNTTYKVHILSNYYLGNDVISFSPRDSYFVTKDGCFEGICGFTIYNAVTLEIIREFGNPETEPANTFLTWLGDNRFEYSVGDEIREFSIE